jgi:hypothetical protein
MQKETKFYPIKVGSKEIMVRKWKVKDRNKFKKLLLADETMENQLLNILVYDCIQDVDNFDISPDEAQYIMLKIRELSISKDVTFNWACSCGHKNKEEIKIDDIVNVSYSDFGTIKVNDNEFTIKSPKNKKFYNEQITKQENIMNFMFAMHLDKLNDGQDFTLEEVMDWLDDLETDEYDEIMLQFNKMIFTADYTNTFVCSKCEKEQKFIFDEIPDFFPEDWLK